MATHPGSATVTLPSDTEILITRRFEAPRALVWEALTTPRHLLRWWGPDWCPLVTCEIDLRPGGRWRYVARDAEGHELAWHGTYQSLDPPGQSISTEVFEGFPEAESLNTTTLNETDGVTELTTLVRHTSKEHRDGHVDSGMEAGMQATFDRLDALLAAADTPAERYRRVAGGFSDRVRAMAPEDWDRPSPCAGWTGRDVVAHLVTWIPAVLRPAGVIDGDSLVQADPAAGADPAELPALDDPVAAWAALDEMLQAALDDPELAARTFDAGPPGEMTVAAAIDMLVVGDVLIHTWDLARTGGLDEHLDPTIAVGMLAGMEPMDAMLRQSGHYGPRVPVPDDADAQTRLIAFTGRQP